VEVRSPTWTARAVALARRREVRAIAVMAALLIAFVLLLFAIRGAGVQHRDLTITLALQRYRSPLLDTVERFFTDVGNFSVIAPMAVPLAIGFWRQGRRWTAFFLVLSLLGHPLNMAIKLIAARPRPSADEDGIAVIMRASGTSFPSGHAMASLLFYGLLAYFAYVLIRHHRRRVIAAALLAMVPVLVGVSRVYVGGHWFSDVVGGWIVGLFFLIAFAEGYRIVGTREVTPVKGESKTIARSP
jgi:membrane-associated phospholipid phosphatase